MAHSDLILDRYEPIGTAGVGGFGTVQIAWDPRIQRKVAIKSIKLTALDAARAALPGAQAVAAPSTAERWHGAVPWSDYLASQGERAELMPGAPEDGPIRDDRADAAHDADWGPEGRGSGLQPEAGLQNLQVTSLAHLPGLDEARTAAMLSDARIVTVYDFEVRGRMAYLIMEYVEGITLTHLLNDYPEYVTLDLVAAVFDAVAGALSAAHEAGVLHLDIKPDNILINLQGQVKVTDFGLATLADASGTGTTGGGTIGYMPLEQMRREHLDARTDEWSLASVTYEMLTGDNPFRASSLSEAEAAIEDAELILPSLCWEDLDDQADDVVFYALDPDREERYATVADFAEELDKFLGDPDEGAELLSLVAQDALGIDDEPDAEAEDRDELDEEYGEWADDGRPIVRAPKAFSRIAALVGAGVEAVGRRDEADKAEYDNSGYADPDYFDEGDSRQTSRGPSRGTRRARSLRLPSADWVSPRTVDACARLFAAIATAFVVWLALANIQALDFALKSAAPFTIAAAAAGMGIVSAVRAHVGAFVAFCLLGISFVTCGHPVVGAVLLVATVAWWYAFGHEGIAPANVALLAPVLGAVGAAPAVPLVAGASMRPASALATTAFAAVIAFVLGTAGTDSLAGWDAFSHWQFAQADIAANALVMAKMPGTWITVAGWIVAAAVLSILYVRGNRLLTFIGVVVAAAAVLVGPIFLGTVTPQLVVAVIVAALIVLAV